MSHLYNALATAEQLETRLADNEIPSDLQDSVRYQTARLTQAAGILLRLPQGIAAQAIVILMRFWVNENLMQYEFADVSAASIYLTAKISASPRSLRSITNVYAYLLSPQSSLTSVLDGESRADPDVYYLSESSYITNRNRILNIEGQILNAIGFDTHVALPHPLAITYLQALDVFGASQPNGTGPLVAQRAIEYLNAALLSPQMLYLTHQPNTLATAAVYLAARDIQAKLPDLEWWEVFDTDREDLGFLALGMRSLEGWVKMEEETWAGKKVITRTDVRTNLGGQRNVIDDLENDEETEMMRLLDEKVK